MEKQPQAIQHPDGGNMDRAKRKPPASFKGMPNLKTVLEEHKIPQTDINRLTKKQLAAWRAKYPERMRVWERG